MRKEVRRAVMERASGVCELCLSMYATNVHHRRPRGMGGSKLGWIDEAPNLLFLCGSGTTGCHGRIESQRALSYEFGWLLRVGYTPERVPYCDVMGQWWLLRGEEKLPIEFGFTAPNPTRSAVTPSGIDLAAPREDTDGHDLPARA